MCDDSNAKVGNASTSSTSMPSSLPQHKLSQDGQKKQNSVNVVRRSRNRHRRASIETSSPSMSMSMRINNSPTTCSRQVDKLSARDVSVEVEFDRSLCVDVGRTFRRDSLLVSKTTYMSKSTEKLVQQQNAESSCDDQRDVPTTTTTKTIPAKRRVRFAEKGKCKIISRIDDIDPQSSQDYWYNREDRNRYEQNILDETRIFRKLHKITKSRQRQSHQEGSIPCSIQQREEELLWAVIDAKSYSVRGLEHLIDRRMYSKMKEEQINVVDSVLRAQDELGPRNNEALASVWASLTKNARLRASLLGIDDQEAVQAMKWEEAQQQKGEKDSSSSLRAL